MAKRGGWSITEAGVEALAEFAGDEFVSELTRRYRLHRRQKQQIQSGYQHPGWAEVVTALGYVPNRLNQRYHTALRLAEVIWQATSPEHAPGSLFANGFLFNLWKIFEDFVVGALSEELQSRHDGVPPYPCHLDEACAVQMEPDLVRHSHGRPVAVVDAKYKQERSLADLYQGLAYCVALGLPRGHLVYARGNAEPRRHLVRYSGIEIVCHALDLTLPPPRLLAQVGDIADELVASSPAG